MIRKLYYLALLIFRPKKLIQICVDIDSGGRSIEQDYIDSKTRCIESIRTTIFESLKWVIWLDAGVLFTWGILSTVWGYPVYFGKIARLIGPCIVLWGVLGRIGFSPVLGTFSGKSLPEAIDKWWYRFVYFIGSYITLVSQIL